MSISRWINKLWYICTVKYLSQIKRNTQAKYVKQERIPKHYAIWEKLDTKLRIVHSQLFGISRKYKSMKKVSDQWLSGAENENRVNSKRHTGAFRGESILKLKYDYCIYLIKLKENCILKIGKFYGLWILSQ